MDDVRKSIKLFLEDISNQIEDRDYSAEDNYQETNTETEISGNKEDGNAVETQTEELTIDRNQFLINLKLALSKADVKPYKDTAFLAQLFVDTPEKKELIDSIRKELTQFIMKRNHYPHMKLEVITSDPNANKTMATSPVERFKVLMETSPAIELLKENFKCEIKY